MKWCTLSFDKKGIFVYWSWCTSYWSEDFDDGESYDLDIPFDWWAKSWKDARDDFDATSPSFIMPFFFAYLFLGIQTIIAVIKRKKRQVRNFGNKNKSFLQVIIGMTN